MAACALLLSGGAMRVHAEEHLVPTTDLHDHIAASSQKRADDVKQVKEFLELPPVRKALETAKIDPRQAVKAVAFLSDDELARLARQSAAAQKDFAAGAMSAQHLTYAVIALSAAVLVLILK